MAAPLLVMALGMALDPVLSNEPEYVEAVMWRGDGWLEIQYISCHHWGKKQKLKSQRAKEGWIKGWKEHGTDDVLMYKPTLGCPVSCSHGLGETLCLVYSYCLLFNGSRLQKAWLGWRIYRWGNEESVAWSMEKWQHPVEKRDTRVLSDDEQ